ncbi:hypothetical protein [Clostridium sp. DMHC 10]|uniref:hypothetical protein n=1 Tax=Clostridium sp. DMHC 10 TaxID=747377 RepID=UPI00325B2F58
MYMCIAILIIVLLILTFRFKGHYSVRVSHKINGLRILHIRPKDIKRYILSYGEFAALVFVIIYSLKPILFVVPASLLSIMAGGIFGPWKAFFSKYDKLLFFSYSCFFFLPKN